MSTDEDSVTPVAPQPRARSKVPADEARQRKNDTGRLLRFLKSGGAVTMDEPNWRRASRSHVRGFNAHVCARFVRRGELVLVDGAVATYRLRGDLMPADD